MPLDAVWLAELTECGLLWDSFIPPREIAAIRELTTLPATDMSEALIAGQRDPVVLAMACGGRFGDQRALMCTLHLEHIDHLADMIGRLGTGINEATEFGALRAPRLPPSPRSRRIGVLADSAPNPA